jgi:hypothetical protein
MSAWKPVGVVVEGEPIDVGGINPWEHKWLSSGESPVKLPHPNYPTQFHDMSVLRVAFGSKEVVFAVGEISAGVYGFYVRA